MTTLVTIKNESAKDSPQSHIVLVKQGGQVIQKLYPGEQSIHVNVWSYSPITIEEAPLA
jgi:hypothetical protein